ncbi:type I restriction enzyme HsdR N-terminal domain-containing protein [Bradyrhizobium sp. 2S1]|uniref:type I restriction enzyme HsdR N-terminal domain-containing protein n=1 Tax=Bradyrhizobium sp. 2S1 TaxID=1404429 RepID=UPI001AEEC571|nr:type I restriction enzyme HsdR N-terminal domain-containing protein [Bradyrhizobium sp. 2S1]MCK7666170.1 type I restriction enzyme HsdR N-terminal domain-containing protein [Bradyrhizobium sp. 2S1]
MGISTKVSARISTQLKKYQKVLAAAKQRDIGEADTVTIITDFLSDALGYDKYKEVSSEHAIRGTYVDRVVTVDSKKRFLIEAKAIGVELKDAHVKQAIDYAANEGVSWVVLSNGAMWRLYNLRFGKPIEKTLVFEIDVLACDCKNDDIISCFGSLSSEAYSKDTLTELLNEKQTSSKYRPRVSAWFASASSGHASIARSRYINSLLKLKNPNCMALGSSFQRSRELVTSCTSEK